jgi:hypothetical protein
MNAQESTEIRVVLHEATPTPLFIPLVDLYPGRQLMGGQSFLRVEGVEGREPPVELMLTLAPLGTPRGTPAEPIIQGDVFPYLDPPEGEVLTTHVPELGNLAGTLGVTIPSGDLPAGTKLTGRVVVMAGVGTARSLA